MEQQDDQTLLALFAADPLKLDDVQVDSLIEIFRKKRIDYILSDKKAAAPKTPKEAKATPKQQELLDLLSQLEV